MTFLEPLPSKSMEAAGLPGSRKRVLSEAVTNLASTMSPKRGYYAVPGRKREDRLLVGVRVLEKNGIIVEADVVIDGHGGSDVANFLERELPSVLSELSHEREEQLDVDLANRDAWTQLLQDAFGQCNDLYDENVQTASQLRAGAVATLVLYGQGMFMIAHVGDGKAVAMTSGNNFSDLTKNHRADDPEERARIESWGGCVVNNRVRGVLAPSRAFGDVLIRTDKHGHVNKNMIKPEPQIVSFSLDKPGCMVIGTDGLFDVIAADSVALATSRFLSRLPNNTLAARFLAEQASLRSDDDVSVIVISW